MDRIQTLEKINDTDIQIEKKNKHILNPEAAIFPISIIAQILEVHQRTLRIYDEEGILIPKRTKKNRRLYSLQDVEKGKVILYLTRELGINLAGVRLILHFMKEAKIAPDNYVTYLQNVAKILNITEEEQAEKKEKLSKRGRKPQNAKI